MPFKSKAQQRYMFKNMPQMAEEWASKTPNMKSLPMHATKEKDKNRKAVAKSRARHKTGRKILI
jgi:hypothetical protein